MDKEKKNDKPHWLPLNWTKRAVPILAPSRQHFVSRNIYEPSVLFDGKTHLMLFRGESLEEAPTACVGRLGIGFSPNGVDFQCQAEPALVPDSPYESRGIAHPRLALVGGVFMLTYAAYDGERYRLCLATSVDLRAWYRHGPIFPEADHEFTAASILPQYSEDGRYYMFVGGADLRMATSTDLLNWELQPKSVLKRKSCADLASRSIEPGPPPFLTRHGIVIILNGTDKRGHTRVFAALLDPSNPAKVLAHLKEPLITAEHDWEMFGYLPHTVRATGLSLFQDTFHLYYSGGDRCIGLATAPVPAGFLPGSEEGESEQPGEKKKVCGV